ncbi:acetylcholinesterase precursor [Diplocarpon rosae]|nr:acetylcholinesterase precursor [Diplocarpon rosae]
MKDRAPPIEALPPCPQVAPHSFIRRQMSSVLRLLSVVAVVVALISGHPLEKPLAAFEHPRVDLGYEIHQGQFNATGQFYNFSNIRYAAPPVGSLRFAPPTAPSVHGRVEVNDGSQMRVCPNAVPAWSTVALQWLTEGINTINITAGYTPPNLSQNSSSIPPPVPGTSEDCLFLDVLVPRAVFDENMKSKGAPVVVWIHGGGYTLGWKTQYGSGAGLLRAGESTGPEAVIYVAINYRLGLFGFLSGNNFTQQHGTPNAGLLDQRFALEWVQKNIGKFGGDPNRVTVMGESAGGGSIMHQITAYGGTKGKAPFQQAIVQSGAFLPVPHSEREEDIYAKFLRLAGKNIGKFGGDPNRVTVMGESAGGGSIMHQITAYGGTKGKAPFQQAIVQSGAFLPVPHSEREEDIYAKFLRLAGVQSLDEARGLSTETLRSVNEVIVGEAAYGDFVFNPAVDGDFSPELPGKALLAGTYDTSLRLLIGHNLDEGLFFTSPFVFSPETFKQNVVLSLFPHADQRNVSDYILHTLYPDDLSGQYGYRDPIARADYIISEALFSCNAQYLARAFSAEGRNAAHSYLFNVPPALHGEDVPYTFFEGPAKAVKNETLARMMQSYFLNFAIAGDPNGEGLPPFGRNPYVGLWGCAPALYL